MLLSADELKNFSEKVKREAGRLIFGGIILSQFMVPERWYSCLVDKRRGPLSSFVGVFLYVAETTDTEREIKLA